MTRVGVLGAAGRMGSECCRAVAAAPDLELVAAVDPSAPGRPLVGLTGVPAELVLAPGPEALLAAGAEVAVEFTRAEPAVANLSWCAANGVHAVSGTTGIGEAALEELAARFGAPGSPNCVLAPNFALTAVLLLRLAELAAPYLEGAEVVELHHEGKADAPSGTAIETARRIAAARVAAGKGPLAGDRTQEERLSGSRGAEGPGGVRIHAVRLPGLVAHEEVLFGAEGQTLSIRQDSYDRSCFMPGVLLAVRQVASRPGLTLGLEPLLGL